MIQLIEKEVRVALEAEASMETANSIVMNDIPEASFYGAECYNSTQQCMALFLTLTLAKLFEEPAPRRGETRAKRHNRSDVASIPLMIRLMRQKRCRNALSNMARAWTPNLTMMEEINAKACEREIDKAIGAYEKFKGSTSTRKTFLKLKLFRDKALAHSLLGEALKETPSYNELFSLMNLARDITNHAKLAILGDNLDLKEHEEELKRISEAFWRPALTAAANTAE